MGLMFNLFAKKTICPVCRSAARTALGKVECANLACPNFAPEFHAMLAEKAAQTPKGNFRVRHAVSIRYRNYLGVEKTFVAEQDSLYEKNNHIVALVEPTGRCISLSKDRITNLNSLGRVLPKSAHN